MVYALHIHGKYQPETYTMKSRCVVSTVTVTENYAMLKSSVFYIQVRLPLTMAWVFVTACRAGEPGRPGPRGAAVRDPSRPKMM